MKRKIWFMVYILACLWVVICWIYAIHNVISDNEENIKRWVTAMGNFLWEKYTDFIDEYAPTD